MMNEKIVFFTLSTRKHLLLRIFFILVAVKPIKNVFCPPRATRFATSKNNYTNCTKIVIDKIFIKV